MQKFVHVEAGEELDYYVVGAVRCKSCVGQLCTSDEQVVWPYPHCDNVVAECAASCYVIHSGMVQRVAWGMVCTQQHVGLPSPHRRSNSPLAMCVAPGVLQWVARTQRVVSKDATSSTRLVCSMPIWEHE
jgi:hypothetical protein